MEPFIGQIMLFGGNFAPVNWALCQGQLLSIQQYTALFSILGTQYGGNGTTNFALPDLRGRVAVGQGSGPGLTSYVIGEMTGSETVTLTTAQMPGHTHLVTADATAGTAMSPSGNHLAESATGAGRNAVVANGYTSGTPTNPVALSPTTVQSQGGNLPHANVQPSLCLNYIIALQGIFPSRS